MRAKNTEKGFLKQRRGFLYNTIRTKQFGTEVSNIKNTKGIPVPRQIDSSNSPFMT